MNFTTTTFLIFLLVTVAMAYFLPARHTKWFLLVANYLFYGYWFPPFVLILLISNFVNYFFAKKIYLSRLKASRWLLLSLITNIGMLVFFKYTNFILENGFSALSFISNKPLVSPQLDILVPLGISFFTFTGLSYVIDVFKNKVKPDYGIVNTFAYLSFFSVLSSGPIIRAGTFVPQLQNIKKINAVDFQVGIYRICQGLFLKIVISNNLGPIVNGIFDSYHGISPIIAWAGAVFFAVQIFCDFAGYSSIAIGVSRLFGFTLPENFNNPYLSTSVGDFWRRWHISLTSWFRDYVYLPASLSRWVRKYIYKPLEKTPFRTDFPILLMFLLSGLWHGAKWTFILWGLIHGLAMIVEKHIGKITTDNRKGIVRVLLVSVSMLSVFLFVVLAWIPFRTGSISLSLDYVKSLFIGNWSFSVAKYFIRAGLLWSGLFIIFQTLSGLKEKYTLSGPVWLTIEASIYLFLVLIAPGTPIDFIYVKF